MTGPQEAFLSALKDWNGLGSTPSAKQATQAACERRGWVDPQTHMITEAGLAALQRPAKVAADRAALIDTARSLRDGDEVELIWVNSHHKPQTEVRVVARSAAPRARDGLETGTVDFVWRRARRSRVLHGPGLSFGIGPKAVLRYRYNRRGGEVIQIKILGRADG